jgi:putative membrane protein
MGNQPASAAGASFDPRDITRPDKSLLRYYLLVALLAGPGYPFALVPLLFRYETLRYRFDDEGVAMSWGVFFRKEVYLTYRRIQDIHLTRNILQRWMGLATVSIQTASGSATPEMSIEGILQAEALRDFLYAKMRGVRGQAEPTAPVVAGSGDHATTADEALGLLREIRDELRQLAGRREGQP